MTSPHTILFYSLVLTLSIFMKVLGGFVGFLPNLRLKDLFRLEVLGHDDQDRFLKDVSV